MQFLKALFLIAFGGVLVLAGYANWKPVTIELWAGLEAVVKLPLLVLVTFLLGFLPTLLLYRARLWSMQRRLETHERNAVMAQMAPPVRTASPAEERIVVEGADQRLAGQGISTAS